ncbi:30S ribosomal protein S13 [Patescibacteria group bacterium]|nr:30S ribosomal protein S13 [Patescibacteria group bacterium]
MARIAGVNIPVDKRVEIALTYIYGIGRSLSRGIVTKAGIDPSKRIKELSEGEINDLRQSIESNHKVEGELRRIVLMNIKRLKEINCYRGGRHVKNLPARGQRTKTNSRTVRGNTRKTAGSGRKTSAQKT